MDHDEVREHQPDVADADLVLRTRSGDAAAFGELWRRHYRSGVTVARNMTSSLDADDLVQEAYTRIYQSIAAGGGPTGSFRAYLFTSIRNTAAAWGRARHETAYDELDGVEDPAAAEHASEAALDRSLTHQAFRSLPTRWQEVLWYSEIERMKPAEIAPLLGMKATAVAQLTFRAREGLREAWIQAHLRSVADGSECQWAIERLGAYARSNLGRRDHAKLERHLAGCVRCSIVASEAKQVSSRLALVLLPLAVGAAGTAGYLASVQSGSGSLVALSAMPSSVVHGAVTVAPGGVVGAGTAAATVGAGTAGASAVGATATAAGTATLVSAGAAGAGSALAGIGAASGLAAASLVVVTGVVAAAVGLPAATPAPEPTIITNEVPADSTLVPDEHEDSAVRLPADAGPGPADIPVLPAIDAVDTTGTDGGAGGAGSGDTPNGNAGGNGNTVGDGGGNAGGNGAGSGAGDGSAGAGNGNTGGGTGNSGNGGDSTGGTPTNGTGNGNGGITGNQGSTGNGTPANGTGNGNGGTTGPGTGNGNAYGSSNGNGGTTGSGNAEGSATGSGKANANANADASNGGPATGSGVLKRGTTGAAASANGNAQGATAPARGVNRVTATASGPVAPRTAPATHTPSAEEEPPSDAGAADSGF